MQKDVIDRPHVSFHARYIPAIAGGRVGQYAAEIYPVRIDTHGTHQLSHTRVGKCKHAIMHSTMIESRTESHEFDVRIDRHPTTTAEGGLFMPYFEGGAYKQSIECARSCDDKTCAASTAVMLHVFVTTYNETGQRCMAEAGVAYVPVNLIQFAQREGTSQTIDVIQNRDNEAAARMNQPLMKGHIVISNCKVHEIVLRNPTRFDIGNDPHRAAEVAQMMNNLIDRGMLPFFGRDPEHKGDPNDAAIGAFLSRPTRNFLSPFHCPEFRTQRMQLQSSSYSTLMPCGEIDVPYYEQLVEIGLRRSGLTRAEAERLGTLALELKGAAFERYGFTSFSIRSMVAFAVSQCYLDDFLNRNIAGASTWSDKKVEGDEDFKICRLCGADDCEGCALEVHMHIRGLCLASAAAVQRMSPLLQMMRRFLRLFVPTLTLGAVTNKKMTTAQLDQKAVMAHTFAMLIPYWQLYNQSSETARAFFDKSRFYKERRAELEFCKSDECLLTAVVGEGTAPIDPAGRTVSSYYERNSRELEQALAAAGARRRMTEEVVDTLQSSGEQNVNLEVFSAIDSSNSDDYSPFYKYPVSFATPEFIDLRTLDWAFVYDRDSKSRRSFGVEYRDVIDPDSRTKRADVIPFVDITEEEARTIDAVLLDQQPIPVLTLPPAEYKSDYERRYTPALIELRNSRTNTEPISGTVLHRRHAFMTIRAEDISDRTLAALHRISRLPSVRSFDFHWWNVNAAIDCSEQHNVVLDVYVTF